MVSIQLLFRWNTRTGLWCFFIFYCFNTTVVSVEYYNSLLFLFFYLVSIQLLFRWNGTLANYSDPEKFVSIQLLFRWNDEFEIIDISKSEWVSIQLLFRWNSRLLNQTKALHCFNTTVVSVEYKKTLSF